MIMLTLKTDLQYYKNWINARQNKTKQKQIEMLFKLDAVYVEILLRAFILVDTFFKCLTYFLANQIAVMFFKI